MIVLGALAQPVVLVALQVVPSMTETVFPPNGLFFWAKLAT